MGHGFTTGQYRQYESWDELFKVMNDIFVDPDNAGMVTRGIAQWYIPFYQYAIKTPLMVSKWIIRNPTKFMVYMRFRDLMTDINDLQWTPAEAGFQDWELESMPYRFGGDKEKGEITMLIPTSWSMIDGTIGWVDSTGKMVRRAMGEQVGTQSQIRAKVRNETNDELVRYMVGNAYPWVKLPYELTTGKDAFTGKKFVDSPLRPSVSYLGASMPWQWRAILSKYPTLDRLNSLNPGGIFGMKPLLQPNGQPVLNEQGKPVEPGRLSFLGAERTDRDWKKHDLEGKNFALNVLRLAGLNVRVVDYDQNIQNSLQDMYRDWETDRKSTRLNSSH